MPSAAANANYEPELPRRDAAPVSAAAAPRTNAKPAKTPVDAPSWSPDLARVQDFLQLLARAIRQFHTYPSTSPLCVDAITVSRNALVSLDSRDRLVCRVTPHELVVDEAGVGAGTIIEHEIVQRLHRVRVGSLEIDRSATFRDLSRFCEAVSRCDEYTKKNLTLAEILVEHGVDAVVLRMAHRPEVLTVGAPRPAIRELVDAERRRQEMVIPVDGPPTYLYPPEKGWVRLDPAATLDKVSLIDLTVLVEDPSDVATMLLRLTDDESTDAEARERALEQKFSDVAMLFSALDPRLARAMFSKLARAVLDLEPDRRKDLLKRTILPGLLDGRADGAVLRDFPDLDLAESLFLLLDLETAAPEVLTTALNRLDLPAERRDAVVPLLEQRLRTGHTPANGATESGLDRYARKLIRVDAATGKSFADFAAFDLSMDAQAAASLAGLREAMAATDILVAQLHCLVSLVRIEPNPTIVEGLLARATAVLSELERTGRWTDLASELVSCRQLADALRENRPDVADAIVNALAAFCTPERMSGVVDLYSRGADGKAVAHAFVEACGAATGSALLALVDGPGVDARALAQLMCDRAALLAPALVGPLADCDAHTARIVIRVLGYAGHGYEAAIAEQLGRRDEQTERDALRALARIGTAEAAAIVGKHLRSDPEHHHASEEALWHFPAAHATALLRDILADRDFVAQHPQLVARLLERAGHNAAAGFATELAGIVQLRFRFWKPAVRRVALKARELLKP